MAWFEFIYLVYAAAFALSGVATGLFTPLAIRVARRFDIVDKPNARKVQVKPVPRLGGAAVLTGILFSFLLLLVFSGIARDLVFSHAKSFLCLIAGAFLLFLVGLVDDIREVSPKTKLFFQLIAGLVAFYGGFQFLLLRGNHAPGDFHGHWVSLSLFLTVFWTLGTTNAVNLIDGLDGLASGITGIAFTLLGFISVSNGHMATALAAFAAAGATCGFLWHNGHPAKIFLGDSGSLLLGFLLSCLSIEGTQQGSLVASLVGPLCLMYIPFLDTFLAIVRRAQKGLPFSFADKFHIHHRLLRKGIQHPRVVQILWGVALSAGSLALILSYVENSYQSLVVNLYAIVLLVLTVRYLANLELFEYLHSLRNINRRKQTARDKIMALRRSLSALDRCVTAEALLRGVTGIAERLGLDSLAIYMAPGSREEERILVHRWTSNPGDWAGAGDWMAKPGGIVRLNATKLYGIQPGSSITVELCRQSWKTRRKSEDVQLWANLMVEKLAASKVLSIFSPCETGAHLHILELQ
ncbi:MAG TPA: MraY family glycosyltransferase [Fibrobacteria bacterium]|nr:MraY family glycosyltransferase [Fibrobacteria bacterium]